MSEDIEIKLEQMTQAIKGLYAKSSMSQGEIYNALTNLSQRYENLVNVSNEKVAAVLVSEFRKTIDSKYNQANQSIKEMEGNLKNLLSSNTVSIPKMSAEVTKLLSDTSNTYAKLNAQDLALQKIFSRIELLKTDSQSDEVSKLSENFVQFSQSFENITATLNKNFTDFLEQVKKFNSKEEYSFIRDDLNTISGNVNSIISAISIIDSKYKDLTSLIDIVKERENVFDIALHEVRNLGVSIENVKDFIRAQTPQIDLQAISNDVRSQIEVVKYEIQKIVNAPLEQSFKDELTNICDSIRSLNLDTESFKREISELTFEVKGLSKNTAAVETSVQGFNEAVEKLNDGISQTNNEVQVAAQGLAVSISEIKDNLSSNGNEIKASLQGITNTVGEVKANNNDVHLSLQNLATTVEKVETNLKTTLEKNQKDGTELISNTLKDSITPILSSLSTFKTDLNTLSSANIKTLLDSIERIMKELKTQEFGKNIQDVSDSLRDVSLEIQSSIQNMQTSLNDMNSVSSVKILTQVSETIPTLTEKLENFRTNLLDENNTNFGQVKTIFTDGFATVSADLKSTNEETLGILKSDIMDYSNQVMENSSAMQEKIEASLDKHTQAVNLTKESLDKQTQAVNSTKETLVNDLMQLKEQFSELSRKHSIESTAIQEKVAQSLNEQTAAAEKDLEKLKTDFQEIATKQKDEISKLKDGLESFSNDAIVKLNDAVNMNKTTSQEVLNEIRSTVLEKLTENNKNSKSILNEYGSKVEKVVEILLGKDQSFSSDTKPIREIVTALEAKVDRANLQQIHNAKELLTEIQSAVSGLHSKLSTSEITRISDKIIEMEDDVAEITKVSEKIQSIEEFNVDLSEEIVDLREKTEQKLKDILQKIAILLEKDNSEKIEKQMQGCISSFEYIKNYLSNFDRVKSALSNELAKVVNEIKKIRTSSNDSNYTYTLEDVESDIAKLKVAVERNSQNADEFKKLFEKVVELRSVGLENVKINRDIEQELGHLSGWFKDTVNKIDDLNDRFDSMQNVGFEDIKTRLVQSERSKNNAIEFNNKIENAIKLVIKNSKEQDMKIDQIAKKLEIISQNQADSFNPSQFIDIFYENMTQTKMLANRVEIMEDKISAIQNCVEKLLNYVEQ